MKGMAYMRTEWNLLRRGRWIRFVLPFAAFYFILVGYTRNFPEHLALDIQHIQYLYSLPFALAALLSGIHSIRRERLIQIQPILHSLPLQPWQWMTGRLLIQSLPYALLTSVPAALFIWRAGSLPIPGAVVTTTAGMLLSVSFSFVFLLALGYTLGSWLPGRVVYFWGMAVGVLILFHPLLLSPWLDSSWITLFHPFLATFNFMYADSFWGFMDIRQVWLHQGIFVFLIPILLCMAVYPLHRQLCIRFPYIRISGIALLSAVLVFLCANAYQSTEKNRIALYQQQLTWIRDNPSPVEEASFVVLDYELNAVHQEDGLLAVDAVLHVRNDSATALDQLPFTLRREMALTKLDLNDQALPYDRSGHGLTAHLPVALEPGQQLELVWSYAGTLQDWEQLGVRENARLLPVHIAAENKLYLPASAGWYPLPGHVKLQQIIPANQNPETGRIFAPAEIEYPHIPSQTNSFWVTLDYPVGVPVYSNLPVVEHSTRDGRQLTVFASDWANGVYLIGGPFQEMTVGRNRLLASYFVNKDALQEAGQIIEAMEGLIDQVLERMNPARRNTYIFRDRAAHEHVIGDVRVVNFSSPFGFRVNMARAILEAERAWPVPPNANSRRLLEVLLAVISYKPEDQIDPRYFTVLYRLSEEEDALLELARQEWSKQQWLDVMRQLYASILEEPEKRIRFDALYSEVTR